MGRISVRSVLEGLLRDKGYRTGDVFGPFDGPGGRVEYAVTIPAGETPPLTARGTVDELRAWIAELPQGAPPRRRREGR